MDNHPLLNQAMQLQTATSEDAAMVRRWFTSEKQIVDWGGPALYYPIDEQAFEQTIQLHELASFSLKDDTHQLVGFGQFYLRLGRHHLGRLAIHPDQRGKGYGRKLIEGLLSEARQSERGRGASLFVMQDNEAAKACYQGMGFVKCPYPEAMPGGMTHCDYMILDER